LHLAFLVLGAFTVASTLVFRNLRRGDGSEEFHERDLGLG